MHKTRLFIFLFLVICLLSFKKHKSNPPPNILFIMSDDHAQRAISAYDSSLILTPNIDRIANEGMIFRNSFVTNSICAPSRAVMLTGKFSHLNGKRDNTDVFNGDQATFPKLLQNAGYETAVIGKWHLKSPPRGFDYWKILLGQGEYYSPRFASSTDTTEVRGYVTDIITDFVLDFLGSRDKKKPFCLLYHHKAPHRNWMPDIQDLHAYENDTLPLPDNFHDNYTGRYAAESADMRITDMYLSYDIKLHPKAYTKETGSGGKAGFKAEDNWNKVLERMTDDKRNKFIAHYAEENKKFQQVVWSDKELAEWKYQRYLKDYLRCIRSVDRNIGRVLDYLDENGLTENTLVVYTSDQGFYLGEHGWYDKRFMYEESLRTPLMMRYPKEITGGSQTDQMVQNIDYAPTFLDIADIEMPDEIQGKTLTSVIKNEVNTEWRNAIYYHYYEYPHGWHKVKKHYGVRTKRYKLIHFYQDTDNWELYDLQKDPMEMNNVYNKTAYEEIQNELYTKLMGLRAKYADEGP